MLLFVGTKMAKLYTIGPVRIPLENFSLLNAVSDLIQILSYISEDESEIELHCRQKFDCFYHFHYQYRMYARINTYFSPAVERYPLEKKNKKKTNWIDILIFLRSSTLSILISPMMLLT